MDKPIDRPCEFGKNLRQARELAEMDLRQVSDLTRIQIRYIEALENEDWDSVPRGVIGRGFVRLICREIDADADAFLEEYKICRDEAPLEHMIPPDTESEFRVGVGGRQFNFMGLRLSKDLMKIISWGIGIAVAVMIILWVWSPWKSSPASDAEPVKEAGAVHSLEIMAVKHTTLIAVADGGDPTTVKLGPSEVKKLEVSKVQLEIPEAEAVRLTWNGESLMAPKVNESGGASVDLPQDLEALKP